MKFLAWLRSKFDRRMPGHCHPDEGADGPDAWMCCPGCRCFYDEDMRPRYLLNYVHDRDRCPGPRP